MAETRNKRIEAELARERRENARRYWAKKDAEREAGRRAMTDPNPTPAPSVERRVEIARIIDPNAEKYRGSVWMEPWRSALAKADDILAHLAQPREWTDEQVEAAARSVAGAHFDRGDYTRSVRWSRDQWIDAHVRDFRDYAKACLAALPPTQGWQPIETAPRDGTKIIVLTKWSRALLAFWGDGYEAEDGPCGGWTAANEDDYPPCWTDGICWASNADEEPSDPPIWWIAAPLMGD